MTDNPSYRGRAGRPGDEYYDDRYRAPQEDPRGGGAARRPDLARIPQNRPATAAAGYPRLAIPTRAAIARGGYPTSGVAMRSSGYPTSGLLRPARVQEPAGYPDPQAGYQDPGGYPIRGRPVPTTVL